MKRKILCFDIMQFTIALCEVLQDKNKTLISEYADGTPAEVSLGIIKSEIDFQKSRVKILCENSSFEDVDIPPEVKAIVKTKQSIGIEIE